MFNFLKKVFSSPKTVDVYQLSKSDVNVIYIDVGMLPANKVKLYLSDMKEQMNSEYPDYKFLLIPTRR
jgi:hypothetical protein